MEFICPAFVALFFLVFAGVFIFVFVAIIVTIVRSMGEAFHNNRQPITTYPARLIAKRTNTSGMESVSTWYYLTFEFTSGERREYIVSGKQYGLVTEGDAGSLTFQGTRFHQFARGPYG